MMGRPRALATVLASLLIASPVLAQPKQTDPQKQQMAGDLVKKAITRAQDGDHLGAIDLYLQAYTLTHEATLLSNVGNEYQEARKPVEALKYFCKYLEEDPTGTNAIYAQVKAKALQIELGNKNVDDRNVCKPAAAPATKEEPLPPTPPPVDDKPSGGGGGSPLRWVGIGVGVLGAGALGAGLFFGAKAQQDSDFISNYRKDHPSESWPDNIHDIEDRGQRYEDRQIQALVAGGVLVAAGVVLFVVGQSRGGSEVTVQPSATPDGGSVTLRATF